MLIHRMRRGETLEMLSARYRVPVCMIAQANRVSMPRDICAGRVLNIPEQRYCLPTADDCDHQPPVYAPPVPFAAYTVREGDSLYSIARRFGLTMRIIEAANSAGNMRVGDVLRIPKVTGVRYCMRPGESLSDIARRFNVDAARLCALNALAPDDIRAGMMLIVG